MKTVITSSDRSFLNLNELKNYAGLLRYLSLRDVFVRYKQTWVGFGWSVIRPAINIGIFGSLSWLVDRTGNPADKFLEVSAAVVFWQLLSTCVNEVSNSLSNNANLFSKVYFPKIILPLSGILVCIIDFLIAFSVFLILFVAIKGLPAWQIVMLPLVIATGLLFCLGFGLLFATASVKYRDVKFILPFIMQVLFYVSPVFLSTEFVLNHNLPEWLKVMYQINPMVFILNFFKYCIYGHFDHFNLIYMLSTYGIIALLLIISLKYFFNFEKSFADYI